jgi:translation initiation factor 2B subunit (eIF-2B alpha/beta/delta family)
MAGLRNATDGLLKRLLELGPAEGARRAKTLSDELVAELRASARSAAANAARLLPPDATVATCSYSSAVIRACKAGREAGSTARVC